MPQRCPLEFACLPGAFWPGVNTFVVGVFVHGDRSGNGLLSVIQAAIAINAVEGSMGVYLEGLAGSAKFRMLKNRFTLLKFG